MCVNGLVFELSYAGPKDLPAASRISSLVFQSFGVLGRKSVDGRLIARVRKSLTVQQREELLRIVGHITDWVSAVVRQIVRNEVGAVHT